MTVIGIGTAASYPEFVKSPIKEENLWDGAPEEFNFSYGLAKRIMSTQSQEYKKQYGFNAIHLIPVNLYGPNYSNNSKEFGEVDSEFKFIKVDENNTIMETINILPIYGFCKCSSFSTMIKIYFSETNPMCMEYDVGSLGTMQITIGEKKNI